MSRIDYSPSVIWISPKTSLSRWASQEQNSLAWEQNPLVPGYRLLAFIAHWGGFHVVNMFVILCTCEAKTNGWHKFWSKLSQLTNHGVDWELVYRNEVLKTTLTGPTTLCLPSPHSFFAQLFSICSSHYLGAWNRLSFLVQLPNYYVFPLHGRLNGMLFSSIKKQHDLQV